MVKREDRQVKNVNFKRFQNPLLELTSHVYSPALLIGCIIAAPEYLGRS